MKLLTLKTIKKQEKHSYQSIGMLPKNWVKMPRAEDILRVMEAVGGVALRFALDEKEGPFGFNKKEDDSDNDK